MSSLGLGAMGVISHFHPDLASAIRVVHRALDLGITCIDTAASYFDSEAILGQALASRPRTDLVLCTKTALRRGNRCRAEIEQSFQRLRTERIEVYQVHHVQYPRELEQVLAADGAVEQLLREQKRGRVGHIGITSHHPGVLGEALRTGAFSTVQLPYNPIEAAAFSPILEIARELDIGVLAMKPLSGGRLTSVEAALRFCSAEPRVACTLAGCTTVEQVDRDVAALAGSTVPDEGDRARMAREIEQLGDLFCRRCRYCEHSCPAHLPIADIFRCHDYLVLNQEYAREEYRKLSNLNECRDCGECERICPYHLPVRSMLETAHGELRRGRLLDVGLRLLHATGTYDRVRSLFFRLGGPRFLPRHRYLHEKPVERR